eukprot:CAMPEP_0113555050 /NCGR_PEP_ID=MMETSP0015_2-20120614/16494_1 /TAXON_ID=2838 /ORGANISM="Odontella" /LENGTH=121 /DNA_ID=CAMNT_0000456269 /DNA_START=140 /DNA_END=507 /DNA_ORIENTATION=+ /assembly_acc=CAM_ASM_000160
MTVYSGARIVVNVYTALADRNVAARSTSMKPQPGGPLAFDGAAAGNVGDPLVVDGAAQPGVNGATHLGEWEGLEGAAASLETPLVQKCLGGEGDEGNDEEEGDDWFDDAELVALEALETHL